jgi:1-deoxy-D-xylulose-5-phosphate reductoisomerase
VHPQSVVHSMVTFVDGSTIAQASPPDMRLPIALALGWPHRVPGAAAACSWDAAQSWTFEPVDHDALPGVRLARWAGEAGGCVPAVFNAANEEAIAAFVAGGLTFTGITDVVEATLAAAEGFRADPTTPADVATAEEWARAHARQRVASAVR